MGVLRTIARQLRRWLNKDEKTLRELMAERGLNEFGRQGTAASAPSSGARAEPAQGGPEPEPPVQAGARVKFVTEFSYDPPGVQRVSVIALNNREFKGYCEGSSELRTFSWGKVRGLMRIIGSGEMLSPYEVYDYYH